MEKQIKKIKWIYSGELLLIAVVFLVIGILELLKVIGIREWVRVVFNVATLAGALWLVADFLWTLLSPKKRAKNSLLDKAMMLPLVPYLLVFDIIGLVTAKYSTVPEYYQIGMPLTFFYIACAYIFQGIYHYYNPVPMVIEMIDELKKEEEAKQAEQNKESEEAPVEQPQEEDKAE